MIYPIRTSGFVRQFLILTLLLGACSSSGTGTIKSQSSVAETSTSAVVVTTTVSPAVEAFSYFEAIAKNSRVGFEAASKLSLGPAKQYALYQNEFLQSKTFAMAEGRSFEEEPLETARVDESGRIVIESAKNRITYSNFEFVNGLLRDFDVEGRPLRKNLYTGGGTVTCGYDAEETNPESCTDSWNTRVLHAYVTAAGDFVLTYEVTIGPEYTSTVREDRTSSGLANHYLKDSDNVEIYATQSVETFARGETRINTVVFAPFSGGDYYLAYLWFRDGGRRTFHGEFLNQRFAG